MSGRMGRITRLEEQLRAAMPPPPPPPEPDPLERMAWRVFDRARQGRLRATGATGALDWRRECARTGLATIHQREAVHKWDAEVHDESDRFHALGYDAWTAELRALGVDIEDILETEWALLPPDARPHKPEAA